MSTTSGDLTEQLLESRALRMLEKISAHLEADPGLIEAMPLEDVRLELLEMGLAKPFINIAEIHRTKGIDSIAYLLSVLSDRIMAILFAAKEELFEDGRDSNLTRALDRLLADSDYNAIAVLSVCLFHDGISNDVLSEVLRWIGRLNHSSSHRERLWLLTQCLSHSSVQVRDSACLGLASLDDPAAIPAIRQAIAKEGSYELREDIKQVLSELQSTQERRQGALLPEKDQKISMEC